MLDGRKDLLDRLDEALDRSPRASAIERGAKLRLRADAAEALRVLKGNGNAAGLSPAQLVAFEAIILVDGTRPMLKVHEDGVDIASLKAGSHWREALALESHLREATQAVGRVFSPQDDGHVGTAWVVAPGLVATNAHVLIEMARPVGGPSGNWAFDDAFLVDFGPGPDATADRAFRIVGVETSTTASMPSRYDPDLIDLAVLRVEEHAPSGIRLPEPLGISNLDPHSLAKSARPVYVVGFPAKPSVANPADAVPAPGTEHQAVLDALLGGLYGTKRLCPGEVLGNLPDLGGHPDTFAYDSSTLGGFSGSPVIAFHSSGHVIGIHVAGLPRRRNYAHPMSAARPLMGL